MTIQDNANTTKPLKILENPNIIVRKKTTRTIGQSSIYKAGVMLSFSSWAESKNEPMPIVNA